MRAPRSSLPCAASLHAAVTGTVINRTTGKPQAGATVALNKLGQNGIELIDQAKSDAQGNFTINQPVQGPHLLRTAFDGVTYNHMLPPGSPTTGVTIDVYNSSKQPGAAKVSKHMFLFEPANGQMIVNETLHLRERRQDRLERSRQGHARILPARRRQRQSAGERHRARRHAHRRAREQDRASPTSTPSISPSSPARPASTSPTRSPTQDGEPYAGKIVTKDDNTYLIAPNGVTMTGDNLSDLGTEPRTQAHIYGLQGASYKIQLTGTEAAPPGAPRSRRSSPRAAARRSSRSCPALYGQAKLILGAGARHPGAGLRAALSHAGYRRNRMSAVAVDGVWKFYGDYPALRDVQLEAAAGCLPRADRPQRRRQDHAAPHHRRLLAARQAARSRSSATRRATPRRAAGSASSATAFRSTTSSRRSRT